MGVGEEHVPVLLDEVVSLLALPDRAHVIDGTFGLGGHARALVERTPGPLTYVAIDRDPEAHARFGQWCESLDVPVRARLIERDFASALVSLAETEPASADAILLDLGVSSPQIDTPERGFSYMHDAPLDMRMDQRSGTTAADLLACSDERELIRIFGDLGEERHARRIARAVLDERAEGASPQTTGELVALVESAVPRGLRRPGHVAKRVFQGLRIAVNAELEQLECALDTVLPLLRERGRLAVISFHSQEDRLVKHRIRSWIDPCTCPPDLPVCACGAVPFASPVTRRPVRASAEEVERNPRAASAVLRVCQRTAAPSPMRGAA